MRGTIRMEKEEQGRRRYDHTIDALKGKKMELDELAIKKIETLELLTQKPPLDILHEALDRYLEAQQKKLLEEEMELKRKETTFSYDEFWDGVEL